MVTQNKVQLTLEGKARGVGAIYKVDAPFDQAFEALQGNVISLRDLAYARMQKGANHSLSQYGSYVKEGAIYIPRRNPLFVAESPIMASATEATNAHRKCREFYLENANSYLAQAEADKKKAPEKRGVLELKQRNSYDVPTNKFGEDEITLWVFKEKAKAYGEFLRGIGVKEMSILAVSTDYDHKQEKPFATQLWLHGLDGGYGSGLVGNSEGFNNGSLAVGYAVRGVSCKVSGEATSQKIEAKYELYSPAKIKSALGKMKLSSLEAQLLKVLKE